MATILVFGSINVDLVTRVPSIPRPGETVLSPGYLTLFGGKGGNQAVAAARLCRGTPTGVAMVGRVGRDAFGDESVANLAANGVDVVGVGRGHVPTGCAFITVDQHGENAITVASGANGFVTADLVPDPIDPDITLVLQMEVAWRESLAVARRVRAAGGRVIWNLAPFPASLTADEFAAISAAADIVVANEGEALAAASLLDRRPSADGSAAAIARLTGTAAIVTAGRRGAVAGTPDGTSLHVPAVPVAALDTTGAGDTFVGILAACLAENMPLRDAMATACHGASLACLTVGAQAGMPDRAALAAARAAAG